MIEIKFTFATLAEAADFLSSYATGEHDSLPIPVRTAMGMQASATPKPSPKPKPEVTAQAEPAATPAASQPTAATAPTAAPASPAAEPVTYEKSGLAVKINKAVEKDKAAVVALLAEFGAPRGPALKPEQFAAFGEKIDALLLS